MGVVAPYTSILRVAGGFEYALFLGSVSFGYTAITAPLPKADAHFVLSYAAKSSVPIFIKSSQRLHRVITSSDAVIPQFKARHALEVLRRLGAADGSSGASVCSDVR